MPGAAGHLALVRVHPTGTNRPGNTGEFPSEQSPEAVAVPS